MYLKLLLNMINWSEDEEAINKNYEMFQFREHFEHT